MAVVLFCLAVCFILVEGADISCSHPDSEGSSQSCFLEVDGGVLHRLHVAAAGYTFPHEM